MKVYIHTQETSNNCIEAKDEEDHFGVDLVNLGDDSVSSKFIFPGCFR